jgi:hypothetical protein
MRIAAIIVATIMLLGSTALGLLGSNRSIQDARVLDEYGAVAQLAAASGDSTAKELAALSDKTGRLRAGGVAFALVGILSLALLVIVFMNKPIVPHVAGALVALSVVTVIINPQYDLGMLAPASARTLAYVVLGFAALGAGAAWAARALKQRRAMA